MGMHSAGADGTVSPPRTSPNRDRTPGLVTSCISLCQALRALNGLNGPEQPHLGPPHTHGLALFKLSLGFLFLLCHQLGVEGCKFGEKAEQSLTPALWRWVSCCAEGLFHKVPLPPTSWLFRRLKPLPGSLAATRWRSGFSVGRGWVRKSHHGAGEERVSSSKCIFGNGELCLM